MTEDNSFAAYEAKCRRAKELEQEILPANKATLFRTLKNAGIAFVNIAFDGSGDSGQFENPVALDAEDKEIPLPEAVVSIQVVSFGVGTIQTIDTNHADMLETLACNVLQEHHGGWENNDGGYGQFRFLVEERSITLRFWERYTETTYHEHSI